MIEVIFGIVAGFAVSLGALFSTSLLHERAARRTPPDPLPPLPPPRYRIRKRNGAWEVQRITHTRIAFGHPYGGDSTTRRELVGVYPTWQKAINHTPLPPHRRGLHP